MVFESGNSSAGEHDVDVWMRSEACQFYVKQRRERCTPMQLLDFSPRLHKNPKVT